MIHIRALRQLARFTMSLQNGDSFNHGIPESLQQRAIDGVGKFHEQDNEVKKEFYTRGETRKVKDVYNRIFKKVKKLGLTIFELISEALGLESKHLRSSAKANGLTSIPSLDP
ncbi:unnamed protein product [Linum tenue]|uniref:Uncharacterized protein n=1 Tax=Linum tenue TaxID=586396 RepID=A0AAV0NHH6_9ROSI|nr:unnamed protein product [Linum tenue]